MGPALSLVSVLKQGLDKSPGEDPPASVIMPGVRKPGPQVTAILSVLQVQSFMRGWLCRRKWKTIVQDYICSPHAESMRKRNQIVFAMVEAESEYVHQLHVLVNGFLRPLRMAASSKKPPISHDDVSSIFLNRWGFAQVQSQAKPTCRS